MLLKIYSGNAKKDSSQTRGWFVGSFMPNDIRNSKDVEIKYGEETAGNARTEWTEKETRTAVCLLIRGKVKFEFKNQAVVLKDEGDYVMWGKGIEHKWEALEDSLCVTIRWPSDPK